MKYDQKYPSLLCLARDTDGVVKTIGEGPCVTCLEQTGWATLERGAAARHLALR